MKFKIRALTLYLGLAGSISGWAQLAPSHLPVLVPESAGISPLDKGLRGHTQLRVLLAANASSSAIALFNTPVSISSVYGLPSVGGSNAIAIVDAFHYPTALQDFNAFSNTFALPLEKSTSSTSNTNRTFQVVYAQGWKPVSGGNFIASWNLEAALDIEWAHAIAPNAKIYLVEAASDSGNDLYTAVLAASRLPGVKEVSMSWGGDEFAGEAYYYDWIFTTPGIVYLAAGGDQASLVEYPSASPNVISCGGTSIKRDPSGNFLGETGWGNTGCGPSTYESRPNFQSKIAPIVGNRRGTTDLSFVADPNTGVYVYDSTPLWGMGGWWILGGTSVASPCLAGVLNLAATSGNGFAPNTASEELRLYSYLGKSNVFRDITVGTDGPFHCAVGWDYITGLGTPIGLAGK